MYVKPENKIEILQRRE